MLARKTGRRWGIERGGREGYLHMPPGQVQKGEGAEGEGGREKSAIAPSPFHVLLIPFLLRRLSEHKNFMGLCDTFVT